MALDLPVGVVALRAVGLSADRQNVILALTVKYSRAERAYSVPIECFEDLVIDLKRLNARAQAAPDDHRRATYLLDAAE
jgi:hypothetical protein